MLGCLLVLGGGYAVLNPRAYVVSSSGPAPGHDYAVTVQDEYSTGRSQVTGYLSIALGVGFFAAGIFWKKVDLSKSLDDL